MAEAARQIARVGLEKHIVAVEIADDIGEAVPQQDMIINQCDGGVRAIHRYES